MTAPATKNAPRIGDLLLKEGLITQDQLNKALQEQRNNGTRVGYNLVKLGYVKETDLTRMLARQHKMPAVDLTKFQVDPRIAKLIPAELALKHRLPGMFGDKENVEAGGLMSYAADLIDLHRRTAVYIDKILKGSKPADLPVEQASKYELVINLKTAKAIGLTIPESILVRATEVIE